MEAGKHTGTYLLIATLGAGLIGTVVLLALGFDFSVLSSFYLVLAQFYLGLFVLIGNRWNGINHAFALFSFSLGAWNFQAALIFYYSPREFFWGDWLIFIFATLMVLFLFLFTMVFPKRKEYFSRSSAILSLIPPSLIILGLLINHRLITQRIDFVEGIRTPVFGPGYNMFVYFVIFYIGCTFYNLLRSYQIANAIERLRLFYFLVGALLSIFGFVITNLILPWMGIASLVRLGAWFSLAFIGSTAYAITKHRLMDISVVISRALAETLTIVFQAALYLLLLFIYQSVTGRQVGLALLLATILYIIFVGQTHQGLRLFLQTTSHKLFLRGKYNYYKELSEVSLRVGRNLSLPSILKTLQDTFVNVVEISDPRVFLPEYFNDPEKVSKRYLPYDLEKVEPVTGGEEIVLDSKLVEQLIRERRPQINLHDPTHELTVPCLLEERLIAIFVLGRKLSEEHYTDEDIHLLEVLASQVAIAIDHTRSYEKIRADLEVAERQLNRSQRLASLGTLTAGVTHEIRNPLTVIRTETERLANKERDIEYLKQFRELLLKHIDRISNIVQRMLSMAKERTHQEEEVDLVELLNGSLQLINFKEVKLHKDLELLPMIKGDPVELEEVFVNLFQNAIDSMPNGGELTVRTYIDEGRAVVEVSDTGKGIPPEIQEKIFDPFFSTRHEGVGLGLSIAYRIIREHGGDIKLTSEVGKGTTFKLLF